MILPFRKIQRGLQFQFDPALTPAFATSTDKGLAIFPHTCGGLNFRFFKFVGRCQIVIRKIIRLSQRRLTDNARGPSARQKSGRIAP